MARYNVDQSYLLSSSTLSSSSASSASSLSSLSNFDLLSTITATTTTTSLPQRPIKTTLTTSASSSSLSSQSSSSSLPSYTLPAATPKAAAAAAVAAISTTTPTMVASDASTTTTTATTRNAIATYDLLKDLVYRQMDNYMRQKRRMRVQRRNKRSHQLSPLPSSSSSEPLLIVDSKNSRGREIINYLSRCLGKMDKGLRSVLNNWQDRDSRHYRMLLRLMRIIRYARIPVYILMTLIGLYTSLTHILSTVEDDSTLIFSATLYHLLTTGGIT